MDEKVPNKNNRCMHQEQNIARWRVTLGLTQEQLAERMELSQNRISQIENTEIITETILSDVAKALGVTVDILKAYDHNASMCNYITYITNNNNTNNNTNSGEVRDGGTGVIVNPIEKIKSLYERWMEEKNQYIKKIESKLESLEEKQNNKS
ncbi:helix-turn-helix protein [Dysgonomonas alginatilytica]|uniref:Helix-turn-helix protein n=1 Tax=Dysgonomonas alginatilytica TaxID=1605892 RepID=A0A2V3PRR0_9BACT|nr:helix-turn-helix transcriptional regulator [Dysgonomonas alginatilytica]PXV64438.1 helix-turn-helix protein [Dysgonomonas alginatilytica]